MAKRGRSEAATKIDTVVARNIRDRRIALGLTQLQLADLVGVTYQQMHKYERGVNRVSAGRLFETAAHLQVTVADLFIGAQSDAAPIAEVPHARMRLNIARQISLTTDARVLVAITGVLNAFAPDAAG